MSLIGLRVIVLETAGNSGKTLRAGFIRAASDPAYINDDISQIKVSRREKPLLLLVVNNKTRYRV